MRHSRIRRFLRHGTLPQLAAFEASARHASFTQAGRELHYAQPSVSAQIRKLTDCVGTPLFEPAGRGIRLTEAGRRLHARCAELFAVLEALEGDLAALRAPGTGRLAIGTCGAAERFVAREAARFGERHPGIEVTLAVGNHAQLAARLAQGDDDLALMADAPSDAPLVRQWVAAQPYVVVAAAGDPLARERQVAFARLAGRPFVLREAGSATRALAERLFAAHGVRPQARLTLSTHAAVRAAVEAGDGLAILPAPVRSEGPDDALAVLDVDGFPVPGAWHLAWPAGARLSPAAQAFLDHMREASARAFPTAAPAPRDRAAA